MPTQLHAKVLVRKCLPLTIVACNLFCICRALQQDCVTCYPIFIEEILADPLTCPADSPPDVEEDISFLCEFATAEAEAATNFTTSPIDILQEGSTLINCTAVNANRGKQTNLITSLKTGSPVPLDCKWNPTTYPFTISQEDPGIPGDAQNSSPDGSTELGVTNQAPAGMPAPTSLPPPPPFSTPRQSSPWDNVVDDWAGFGQGPPLPPQPSLLPLQLSGSFESSAKMWTPEPVLPGLAVSPADDDSFGPRDGSLGLLDDPAPMQHRDQIPAAILPSLPAEPVEDGDSAGSLWPAPLPDALSTRSWLVSDPTVNELPQPAVAPLPPALEASQQPQPAVAGWDSNLVESGDTAGFLTPPPLLGDTGIITPPSRPDSTGNAGSINPLLQVDARAGFLNPPTQQEDSAAGFIGKPPGVPGGSQQAPNEWSFVAPVVFNPDSTQSDVLEGGAAPSLTPPPAPPFLADVPRHAPMLPNQHWLPMPGVPQPMHIVPQPMPVVPQPVPWANAPPRFGGESNPWGGFATTPIPPSGGDAAGDLDSLSDVGSDGLPGELQTPQQPTLQPGKQQWQGPVNWQPVQIHAVPWLHRLRQASTAKQAQQKMERT